MRRMSIDCTDCEEPSPGNDIGRLYSGTLLMIESRPGSIRAADPAPEYVRIVRKPEVITGPDTKSQLAPSPGKTAARKQAHYRGATSSAYRMTLLLFTRRDTETLVDHFGSANSVTTATVATTVCINTI